MEQQSEALSKYITDWYRIEANSYGFSDRCIRQVNPSARGNCVRKYGVIRARIEVGIQNNRSRGADQRYGNDSLRAHPASAE